MADTGWLSPGTIVEDTSAGSRTWSNVTNAAASDDSYATATLLTATVTYLLKATNFGASIPAGATITGIETVVEASSSGTPAIKDDNVYLVKANDEYTLHSASTGSTIAISDTEYTFGNSTSLWNETWTADDINNSNFGVGYQFNGVTVAPP